jgi:hypothetical protein
VRRVNDDPKHRADGIHALRGIWAESGGGAKELLEERRREPTPRSPEIVDHAAEHSCAVVDLRAPAV